MAASVSDLKTHAKLVQQLVQTSVGSRGSLDFVDDGWAGANNFDPNNVNKGPIFFNQTNLDLVFPAGTFTPTEWTAIEGAMSAWHSAVGANAQLFQRLVNVIINT